MSRKILLMLTTCSALLAVGAIVPGLLSVGSVDPAWAATPLEGMAGYWTGSGSVALNSGKTERVKCSVTYKVGDAGGLIKQNMRCASQDYTINASADLRVKGEHVSGNWEEKTYSATGQVSGRYADNSMNLNIKGANFSAAMNLSLSDCKQTISITPHGLDVSRINIALAKC
jgi:hypothetical protein